MDNDISHILFQDESMIRDYLAVGSTWFLKGQQKQVPTFGQHKGVKLIDSLNYETGEIYCIEKENYDAKVFEEFLKNILTQYPYGKIVMILDNAKIHHAKLLKPLLEANTRLQLMFLPPYSPQLNLIEGLWKWLKEKIIKNVFYGSVNEIRSNVSTFIDKINLEKASIINRLCVQM